MASSNFRGAASIRAIDFSKRAKSISSGADARVMVSTTEGEGGVMVSTAEGEGGLRRLISFKGVDLFQKSWKRQDAWRSKRPNS